MNTYKMMNLKIVAFLVSCTMAASLFADGYRNPPPTAEGIAKSGANMVFADDASAISYNPANLAFQTNASVVVAATFARSENTYYPAPPVKIVSDDPWVLLPNLYASAPISDGVVAGLGITTPFGQGISWGVGAFPAPGPAGVPVLYDAEIALVNINPTVALKVGESVSLGVGADVYVSALEFKALLPVFGDSKAEGVGAGIGANAGLTVKVTDKQTATFIYRSRVDVDYDGDFSIGGVPAGDFSAKIKYPSSAAVGYGIQLTDTVQVEAFLEWLGWSVNDVQIINAGALPPVAQVNDWNDTITAAIGGSWQFADGWVFRTGYIFMESPIPDATITPILPDADRHVIGLGIGYTVKGHSLDLSYAYSIFEDRISPAGSAAPGTYDIDSDLVGVTYSYSF
jgi:long-chain fatty acid transport protein